MATSATGRENNRRGRPLHASGGFTLLEVLVVLVIIAVIVGMAVLAVDTGPEELRREGNRIAALLELAGEEAVMNGREYRLVLHRHDYAFQRLQDGKWQGSEDDQFRPRQLPDGMALELTMADQPQPLSDSDAPEQSEPVALFLLSSGEISPFELTVSDAAGGKITVHSDGNTITTAPTG
ncbi:MAG: type II secretion system minor pseudopilin GspH [Desulfobulbaceae bacterium]|nr:type II secretion system minor pseudopilin GspH [Desulfobulbaceae bacterium]